MTRKEIQNTPRYKYHHQAMRRGYVSRRASLDDLPAEEYSGRFGKGYTVKTPYKRSSQYCEIEYWIEEARA